MTNIMSFLVLLSLKRNVMVALLPFIGPFSKMAATDLNELKLN